MNVSLNSHGTQSKARPFDALSPEEIRQGVSLLKPFVGEEATFVSVCLEEPDKQSVMASSNDQRFARRLVFVGHNQVEGKLDGGFEAIIDLGKESVEVARIEVGQASINFRDVVSAHQITKSDEGWQEAVKKRGVTNLELVHLEPWPAGGALHESIPRGHRAQRVIAFVKEDKTDNPYARPIQGLIAHVDLTEGKLAYLEDHGVVALPPEGGRYDAVSQPKLRETLKPIEISQPDGASFIVDGNYVEWEGFSFQVSMHPTNSLVLHNLCFRDDNEERPILHRAALSEMVVPYGDTDPMHNWKHVFDAGELSMGTSPHELKLGCDCLGEIHYFSHHGVNWNGEVKTTENAICMHEEDYGVLWKHHDWVTQQTEVRRSRRLVISTIHTVGNYEYGFFWHLYLDGTVQMEVKLTGIVGVSAVESGAERPEFAPLIAPNLASPIHQHLFCFRLDFNVDGPKNTVFEVEAEPLPIDDSNPNGTAFRSKATALNSELDARRDCYPQRSRFWKIVNPNKKNRLGVSVAWKLLPSATPTLLADESSTFGKRAAFAKHNLWVTRFVQGAYNACGKFPNLQHEGGEGLPKWSAQDRNIENEDVVLWHTFGVTHSPRPEDWPVMPVEYCGFMLQPVGFFDRNPTLDVPPSQSCSSDET